MILRKELGIDSFRDLLELYPYRHLDKSRVSLISDISTSTEFILISGSLGTFQILGEGKSRRLITTLKEFFS
jgi:ATP-dependent DNA helicase RecG